MMPPLDPGPMLDKPKPPSGRWVEAGFSWNVGDPVPPQVLLHRFLERVLWAIIIIGSISIGLGLFWIGAQL